MNDIAKAAGCSQATVSFVLNRVGGVKISEETRAKVFEAAQSLGYGSPAQGRRQGAPSSSLRSIGFLVDQLATSPESINAIDGARQASWDDQTVILVAQSLGNPDMERLAIEAMLQSGIAGLIYMAIFTRKVVLPEYIRGLTVPVVLSNCYTDDHACPAVVPDELAGGRRATPHCHDHRRTVDGGGPGPSQRLQARPGRCRTHRRSQADRRRQLDAERRLRCDAKTPGPERAADSHLLPERQDGVGMFCRTRRSGASHPP
jgi:LacI family transcriptional regulator